MKIAVWNIERLKHSPEKIKAAVRETGADILVLTEYDDRLKLDYKHCLFTPALPGIEGTRFGTLRYAPTEHRTAVFTDYPCVRRYASADGYTSVCAEFETERGNLIVYGTIFGTYDVTTTFPLDLERQLPDIGRFSGNGNLCVCGDFNCFFTGWCYPSKFGRDTLLKFFAENRLKLLTADLPQCIDHIAVSENFLNGCTVQTEEWNSDKKLSDHKGTMIILNYRNPAK